MLRRHPMFTRESRESGFSMVELSVYVVVLSLIVGVVWVITANFQAARDNNDLARSSASREAILTTQLTRDTQQSTWLHAAGDSLRMRVDGQCVSWTIVSGSLKRTQGTDVRDFGAFSAAGSRAFDGAGTSPSSALVKGHGLLKVNAELGSGDANGYQLSVRHAENGKGPAC